MYTSSLKRLVFNFTGSSRLIGLPHLLVFGNNVVPGNLGLLYVICHFSLILGPPLWEAAERRLLHGNCRLARFGGYVGYRTMSQQKHFLLKDSALKCRSHFKAKSCIKESCAGWIRVTSQKTQALFCKGARSLPGPQTRAMCRLGGHPGKLVRWCHRPRFNKNKQIGRFGHMEMVDVTITKKD